MDSTVIAGLIGAFSTLIATVLSPYFTNKLKENKKAKYTPSAPHARQNSLYGTWVGILDQKVGINNVLHKHTLHLIFDENSQPIVGTMRLEFKITGGVFLDGQQSLDAQVENVIYDGRIFKCDCINKDSNVTHFLTFYGELLSSGREIRGEFLGYGLVSERFVSGSIELKKQKRMT